MTTSQRDRLQWLTRNSQPVTVTALTEMWQCSLDTARTTLALCGYVLAVGNWHHPDHAPAPEPAPEPEPTPIAPPPTLRLLPKSAAPYPQPLTRNPLPSPVLRRLPTWVTVDPIDLAADLQANAVTRTWLLANVAPDQWPHPHRTPCPACSLLQPCLNLSRHRQATICEAVITQRRLDHANVHSQPDFYRTHARFGPTGQADVRTLHPAQNASLAAG